MQRQTDPHLEKLSALRALTGHTSTVMSIAISSDRQWLFSGSDDCTIKVWDLSTGQAVSTLAGHNGPVYSIVISADRKTLVSGSYDGTIWVWRIE